MLAGFHDGDQVWVTVEIRFENRSQWRLGLRSMWRLVVGDVVESV